MVTLRNAGGRFISNTPQPGMDFPETMYQRGKRRSSTGQASRYKRAFGQRSGGEGGIQIILSGVDQAWDRFTALSNSAADAAKARILVGSNLPYAYGIETGRRRSGRRARVRPRWIDNPRRRTRRVIDPAHYLKGAYEAMGKRYSPLLQAYATDVWEPVWEDDKIVAHRQVGPSYSRLVDNFGFMDLMYQFADSVVRSAKQRAPRGDPYAHLPGHRPGTLRRSIRVYPSGSLRQP